MNTLYFLLKSLNKMSAKFRAKPKTPPHCIFHKGLFKLLIINHLREIGRTWDHFMFWGGFVKECVAKIKGREGKKQRKKHTPVQKSEAVQSNSVVLSQSKSKLSLEK